MSFGRDSDPVPSDPSGRQGRLLHVRQDVRVGLLADGTIACPSCDAPVAPGPGTMGPADRMRCPLCDHDGRVRDFLTLASPARPARPARVQVRVVRPGRLRIDPAARPG